MSGAASTPNAQVAAAAALTNGASARSAARARPVLIAPLSEASLAQRVLQARDEGTVIHVSIGRIDVVAASGPPPAAARRTPSSRQGTVALADYLRAGKDGGR